MRVANSKRNDEFDFGLDEDIEGERQLPNQLSPQPIKAKQPVARSNNHDFIGLDDEEEDRDRLPIINQPSKAKLQQDSRTSAKGSNKLQKIASRDVTYDYLDEDVEEEPPSKKYVAPPSVVKPASSQRKRDEEEYEQSPAPKFEAAKKEEDEYGEDFEADAYGEDFEDFHDDSKVKSPENTSKKNPSPAVTKKEQPASHKAVSSNKYTEPSKTILKQRSLRRNNSRGSVRSEKSRGSIKGKGATGYASVGDDVNKFSSEVDKLFPDVELNGMSTDNLNKLNERVRGMIRRLNDELNEILTRNTLLLKAKKEGRSRSKDPQERLRILAEEKKNNEKILQRMDEQMKKMRHREGKLKEEDYQIDIHKRILSMAQTKKEVEKEIYRLKLDVEGGGKRLASGNERKEQDSQNTFKSDLVHQKKQELRLTQALRVVEKKLEEMEPRHAEAEQKLNALFREAASNGVDLAPVRSVLKTKYDELNKKLESEKRNLGMLDGLFKSKKEKHIQETTALKRNSQITETQIRGVQSEISHIIEQCRLAIQKARENPRMPKVIEGSLEIISQSLLVNDPEFDRATEKSEKSSYSEKPRLQSAGKKKSNSTHQPKQDEYLPLNPKKLAKNLEEEKKSMSPVAKPNFKKRDNTQGDDKNMERVWKDDIDNADLRSPPVVPTSLPVRANLQKEAPAPEPAKPLVVDSSKPTFMLKKRTNNSSLNNALADSESPQVAKEPARQEQPVIEMKLKSNPQTTPPQEQVKPVEEKPFGGRLMRLRRNEGEKQPASNTPSQQSTIDPKPIQESIPTSNTSSQRKIAVGGDIEPIKQEAPVEDKPIIAPRRMMLRKKEEGENGGGGYNPTFKKEEPMKIPEDSPALLPESRSRPVLNVPPPAPVQVQAQKPNLSINNPYAPKVVEAEAPNKPLIQLSRRQLQENPPIKQQKPAAPAEIPNPAPVNNPYNPYAPKQSGAQGAVRQREGRLKKPKMQIGKEKITNIYEAAEEPAINEFISEKKPDPKPVIVLQDAPKQHKHEELDINQLLGIGNKKKDQEDQLLFGGAKKAEEKKPARRRGQDDFFGGLDV